MEIPKGLRLLAATADSVYEQCLREVARAPSGTTADPELFFESTAQFLIDSGGKHVTPLYLDQGAIVGDPDYSAPSHALASTFRRVRAHYERLLLEQQSLTSIVTFLRVHPWSKRALLTFWPAGHPRRGDDDPCLVYLWFRRKGDSLDCHAHMRANDAYRKLLMNLHILLAAHNFVATRLALRVGCYRHFSDSLHCYMGDIDVIKAFAASADANDSKR